MHSGLGKIAACVGAAVWLFAVGHVGAQTIVPGTYWVGSWAASQQVPEPRNALAAEDLHDATLRQIVHLSAGEASCGCVCRMRLGRRRCM